MDAKEVYETVKKFLEDLDKYLIENTLEPKYSDFHYKLIVGNKTYEFDKLCKNSYSLHVLPKSYWGLRFRAERLFPRNFKDVGMIYEDWGTTFYIEIEDIYRFYCGIDDVQKQIQTQLEAKNARFRTTYPSLETWAKTNGMTVPGEDAIWLFNEAQ